MTELQKWATERNRRTYWRLRGECFVEALAELAEEREAEGNEGAAAHYRQAHEALRELVGGDPENGGVTWD